MEWTVHTEKALGYKGEDDVSHLTIGKPTWSIVKEQVDCLYCSEASKNAELADQNYINETEHTRESNRSRWYFEFRIEYGNSIFETHVGAPLPVSLSLALVRKL